MRLRLPLHHRLQRRSPSPSLRDGEDPGLLLNLGSSGEVFDLSKHCKLREK